MLFPVFVSFLMGVLLGFALAYREAIKDLDKVMSKVFTGLKDAMTVKVKPE